MKVFIALSVATLALPAATTAAPGFSGGGMRFAGPPMGQAWHGTFINSNVIGGRGDRGVSGAGTRSVGGVKTIERSTATSPTATSTRTISARPEVMRDVKAGQAGAGMTPPK